MSALKKKVQSGKKKIGKVITRKKDVNLFLKKTMHGQTSNMEKIVTDNICSQENSIKTQFIVEIPFRKHRVGLALLLNSKSLAL